jgi:peptidoglycan/LPS O-acetylase OafA/YrhL
MRLPYIDFAKGYAILTIMLFHALQRVDLPALAQKAIVFGGTGVHLFFLLSGFGLMLSKHSGSALAFYQRRLYKVWWPYALALTLALGCAMGMGMFPDGWQAWLAGVLGYQMFVPAYIESFGGHYWFISAIFQFYIVFPALLWLFHRVGNRLNFSLLCLSVSMTWWIAVFLLDKGSVRTWNSFFLQFLWEFGLGMAFADGLQQGTLNSIGQKYWQYGRWWLWTLGGMLGAGAMLLLVLKTGRLGPIFNDVFALVGYGMLSVGVFLFFEKCLPRVVSFFQWVGNISFSVYLVHIMVLELFLLTMQRMGVSMSIVSIPLFLLAALAAGRFFDEMTGKILFKYPFIN